MSRKPRNPNQSDMVADIMENQQAMKEASHTEMGNLLQQCHVPDFCFIKKQYNRFLNNELTNDLLERYCKAVHGFHILSELRDWDNYQKTHPHVTR